MSQASYPDGWHDYKAFCSSDRTTWHRVQTTSYVGGKLVIDLRPVPSDCVYLAYFVPYNYERHLDFVASTVAASRGGGGGGGPAGTGQCWQTGGSSGWAQERSRRDTHG